MKKLTRKEKSSKKDTLSNVIAFILGVFLIFVGGLIFYTKMAGTHWGDAIEGIVPQVVGVFLILLGIYVMIKSTMKIYLKK